uniref:Uncharacterized protein n=1 Tax=Marinobacter nauticus TaxID=2743 RepID=A0A455W3A3_MARNT|nr:hypothetical protein YBY_12480 [Marinobacter nauticus]
MGTDPKRTRYRGWEMDRGKRGSVPVRGQTLGDRPYSAEAIRLALPPAAVVSMHRCRSIT